MSWGRAAAPAKQFKQDAQFLTCALAIQHPNMFSFIYGIIVKFITDSFKSFIIVEHPDRLPLPNAPISLTFHTTVTGIVCFFYHTTVTGVGFFYESIQQ